MFFATQTLQENYDFVLPNFPVPNVITMSKLSDIRTKLVFLLSVAMTGTGAIREPVTLSVRKNFTDLDCDFGLDDSCHWSWDADTLRPDQIRAIDRDATHLPGQEGFIRLNGEQIIWVSNRTSFDVHERGKARKFFGPIKDRRGASGGKTNVEATVHSS